MTEKEFNILFDKLTPVQHKDELWWMVEKIKEIKPKVIVEIGVEFGGTLGTWGKLLPKDGLLIGIDINGGKSGEVEKSIEDVKCEKHMLFADSHKEETKEGLITLLNGKEIDFLFIDGDHTYNGVRKDYEMYSSLVRPGGIIGFHDINNEDVNKLWAGLRGEKHEYTIRIGVGYMIKRKK